MTPSSAPARVAVITFPGSQDDRDAVLALNNLGAQAVSRLARGEELPDVGAVVLPGGFSYGDYLRAGALARFSPAMEAVARFAADGGLVLGICNGFQILCEAGLLPGVLRGNVSLGFRVPRRPRTRRAGGHRLHLPLRFRPAAGHPGQARRRLLVRRRGARLRARGERPDPPPLRGEPERLAADVAGVMNREGNVMGLMPHPEHAVDPLLGSPTAPSYSSRCSTPFANALPSRRTASLQAERRGELRVLSERLPQTFEVARA